MPDGVHVRLKVGPGVPVALVDGESDDVRVRL